MAMPYRTWAKMDEATQSEIRDSAKAFLDRLDAVAEAY
jgi:deoxyribodipyrimidine photolyase-related protein